MEHKIVKDESSEESKESQELDLEIREFPKGGLVCNILACENQKQQVSEGIEVAELEVFPVRGLIDNKSTFAAIHTIAAISDKRLRGNIGVIKLIFNEEDARVYMPGDNCSRRG